MTYINIYKSANSRVKYLRRAEHAVHCLPIFSLLVLFRFYRILDVRHGPSYQKPLRFFPKIQNVKKTRLTGGRYNCHREAIYSIHIRRD